MSTMTNITYGPQQAAHQSDDIPAGARRVFADVAGKLFLRRAAWCGWLMPQFNDSRQQPKCLAMRLLEERVKLVPPESARPMHRKNTSVFVTDKDGGITVFDRFTNQNLGYILPTVSDEVLRSSPGIQSWSIPSKKKAEVVPIRKVLSRAEEDARKGRMLPDVLR